MIFISHSYIDLSGFCDARLIHNTTERSTRVVVCLLRCAYSLLPPSPSSLFLRNACARLKKNERDNLIADRYDLRHLRVKDSRNDLEKIAIVI